MNEDIFLFSFDKVVSADFWYSSLQITLFLKRLVISRFSLEYKHLQYLKFDDIILNTEK